ncbi:MAG: hypothetical protein ACJAZK_003082 [Psychroserpens sp.]|jgi:hypothetical protein|uniref:rhodanese-like domain-containing protein n=1 Tax=Psychroserpens sp. TaxID=2020870 RepID=UPI0039E44822
MKTAIILTIMTLLMCSTSEIEKLDYPKAKVNYSNFEKLVNEVKDRRQTRLISFDAFFEKSKDANVIILDTRSKAMCNKRHIKETLHLNFLDFSQSNLVKITPDTDTTNLIYCTTKFDGEEVHFMSKTSWLPPYEEEKKTDIIIGFKYPTSINLYGHGHKNSYELDELIFLTNQRIEYEGT